MSMYFKSMQYSPRLFRIGAWSQHVFFAYDLVASLKPKILVELGTHQGESFFSFCQSIAENQISCTAYAIDTWEGDKHSGFYGEDIYQAVLRHRDQYYQQFAYLLRGQFDHFLKQFSDETIDLLHIDGLHTYEAVKHDFETWLPKMSKQGVILFHDIVVRHDDFGVWKLWEELSKKYPTFSFLQGWGLGVLFLNPESAQKIELLSELLEAKDDVQFELSYIYLLLFECYSAKKRISEELQPDLRRTQDQVNQLTQQVKEYSRLLEESRSFLGFIKSRVKSVIRYIKCKQ